MSDHRDGGGLPIVGILAALLILPVGAWFFLAASPAPTAVRSAPVPATPTALSPVESGSALGQDELEDSVEAAPEASSSKEAPNEEVVPGESTEADSE
jgi:hypothetical protein